MDTKPDCTLIIGTKETKFYTLESERFPLSTLPLEMRLEGDIVLELEHMVSPEKNWNEPEYFVKLEVGRYLGASMGNFKNEEAARQRYNQCLNTLKNGGRISFRVEDPQILDSDGNLVIKESYGRNAED
jgi:hypothetical protein